MEVEPKRPEDAFAKVAFNMMRFRADMERPPCKSTYQIFFTPRSGSSWLTGVLSSTMALGVPDEYFNPDFLLPNARSLNANNLTRYIAMLKRKRAQGGVFGFEITYFQMLKTFGSELFYRQHFGPHIPAFYLFRKDIVKQAISLWKLADARIGHSTHVKQADIAKVDAILNYNQVEIRKWIMHILRQEVGFNRFFGQFGYKPERLCYEDITATDAVGVAKYFVGRLGIECKPLASAASDHEKIGSLLNEDFAARFCEEEAKFVEMIQSERRNMHDF